ncbi:MAG: D-2-hydroxyacid dehydrogenase [Anaerolineae bacterium]|nr:D-2-hydroxyacid dehydrogenase [Anaerolineae bacterium]
MRTILLSFEPDKLRDEWLVQIQEIAPDMRVLVTCNWEEIEVALDEIEIAVLDFPHDLLPQARNLRWFQQWAAGADWLLRHPEVVDLDFVLTNASGVHPIPITEHIFALLLAFARMIDQSVRYQTLGEWMPDERKKNVFELADKTMVLIGVGAIGERTAQVATAFGMRALGVRRNPQVGVPGVEAMVGPDDLLEILPEADFVVVTAPLTAETRGMIGERELRAMKPTAYLVNIGRGGIVDEGALIRALEEGWIAGAGLDVFEEEPLPEGSPLWRMENVIVTAHYAGFNPHYDERAMAIFLDNLRRYRAGEPLRNVVDKKLGY